MSDTHVMELPDGRALSWIELGDPDGVPVIGLHGTPGSRLQLAANAASVKAAGVRLICPDRPGYGLSTFHSRRTLPDFAHDAAALADHLRIDRFAVVGVSGGGPHALACASVTPGRIIAAGVVSGIGPISARGSEEGMLGRNQLMTRAARQAPALLLPMLSLMTAAGRRWPERILEASRRQVPPQDAEVLGRPEVMAAFVSDLQHASRTAARAAVQDFALFARDWGFRLEDVRVPVHFWHGDRDRNVPPEHARLLAKRVPGSVLHECPGEAHLLVIDHMEEILRTVAA